MAISKRITTINRRFLNPVTLRLVGHGSLAEIEHIGRRTGKTYHTPVMAFRDGDTVTIALTYGPDVSWRKNIEAAGGCRMRLGRDPIRLGAARSVDAPEALSRIPQPQRTLLQWPIKCTDFIALPVLVDR